jgi:hypothetical protein
LALLTLEIFGAGCILIGLLFMGFVITTLVGF